MLRLADFFMRLEARLSYALIGLVQATGYAGGLDFLHFSHWESMVRIQSATSMR